MYIPKKVSTRLIKEIPVFQKVLKRAKNRDINEADTVTIITDMLSAVFGFDKYAEITAEHAIKGTYCDLAVKLDGKVKYLIEVKAIGLSLQNNHLRQAVDYGARSGIPWVVLTNGVSWEIHKITLDRSVDNEQICEFNFTTLNPKKQDDLEKVYLLCKDGNVKSAMSEFHERVQVVNRFMISAASLTDYVLGSIRTQLRKVSPKLKITDEEIKDILLAEVFKRDLVEDGDFDLAKKKYKKIANKAKQKSKPKPPNSTAPGSEVEISQPE